MSTHSCFASSFVHTRMIIQTMEPRSQQPPPTTSTTSPTEASTTTRPASTTTLSRQTTTRSRIGGPRQEACAFSIVVFSFVPPSIGLSVFSFMSVPRHLMLPLTLVCYQAYVFEPSRPWLVIYSLYELIYVLEL